jgi:cbb3-type cytochrome oxidase subunit 3
MEQVQIPEAFQSVFNMGMARRYFTVKKASRIGSLIGSVVLLGGSMVLFLYGAWEAYQAYRRHGPAMIDDKLTGPAVFAFLLFLLGLLAIWSAYANWNKGAVAYEKGFAYRDRKGIQAWRWEDLVSQTAAVTRHYTNGIYTGTTHVYTLFNREGKRLVLNDSLAKVEELAALIEAGTFPLLYEKAAQQYNTGQTLTFGPVVISKGGILVGRKTYPWQEVKEVSIQQGVLKVSKKDGGWFSGASAMASTIPNLRVLLSIIDQVVGIKAGR